MAPPSSPPVRRTRAKSSSASSSADLAEEAAPAMAKKRKLAPRKSKGKRKQHSDDEDDEDDDDEDEVDEADLCELCRVNENDELSLICDACDKVYHTYCLEPPLKAIPAGDWVCPKCVKQEPSTEPPRSATKPATSPASRQTYETARLPSQPSAQLQQQQPSQQQQLPRTSLAVPPSFPVQTYHQAPQSRPPHIAPNQPPPGYPHSSPASGMHHPLRPSAHVRQLPMPNPPYHNGPPPMQGHPGHRPPQHHQQPPPLQPLQPPPPHGYDHRPQSSFPMDAASTGGNGSSANAPPFLTQDRGKARDMLELSEQNDLLRRENQKLIEWVDRLTRRVDELSAVEETLRATQYKYRKMESQLLDLQAQLAMSTPGAKGYQRPYHPPTDYRPEYVANRRTDPYGAPPAAYSLPPPPASEEAPPPPPRPAKSSSGRYFPKGYGQPYEAPAPAPHPSSYAQHSASTRHGHHATPLPPPPARGNYRGFDFPKPAPSMAYGGSPRSGLAPLAKRPLLPEKSTTPTHAVKGPQPVQTPPRTYRASTEDDEDGDDTEPRLKKSKRLSPWAESYRQAQEADTDAADVLKSIRQSDRPRLSPPEASDGAKIGVYTPRSRRLMLERYHLKRTKRLTRHKWFKYPVRKTLADSRPRVKGRFVKNDELDGSPGGASTPTRYDAAKPPIVVPNDFDYIQAFATCVKDTQVAVENVVADIVAHKQRQGELISWDTWTMELEHSLIALLPKDYASSPFPAIFAELVYILGDAEEECSQANYCKALQAGAIYVAICLSLYTSLEPPSAYAGDADLSPIVRYYLASIDEMYRSTPKVERRHTFALMKAIVDGIAGVICTGFDAGKRYLRPVSIPTLLHSSNSSRPPDDESAL
ncbi:hypothetical protein ACHHYP_04424 [Achlya hypogyna]|uniref:PHD-type domain-containing protein n=1 Tax=Achlya hypogyna TaxID=1202772 RepID=A0A1V9ZPU2_ACHHY|nr:hypothetical protein ACHHYP_04424 [Achlya hypogyna]